ncbi:hypothetical protein K435DRAFT_597299, partial [Dendrothele bispora CBS 962.96]
PIVDSQDRVVAVLAGRPKGDNWDALMKRAAEEIEQTRGQIRPKNSTRGKFPSAEFGFGHGGGRKKPSNVHQPSATALARLTGLLMLQCFQSLVGFANCIFQAYAPETHAYYWGCMQKLRGWDPSLCSLFSDSVFASYTVNFGPVTVSHPHTDSANLSFGWCAITALGRFDPDKGGHLILWDLNLIIRFPPGSTILIPSALLTHSNTPIQDGEFRYSFVQYSAAALFR